VTWLIAGLLSFGLAGIAYKLNWLGPDGAIAAAIIGVVIYGIGELPFSFSVVYFFFTANILGKYKRRRQALTKRTESRNSVQVFANGLVPLVLVILWGFVQDAALVLFFLTAICTATADTWATELGALSKNQPRSIINFRRVEAGTSGGISSLGTVAACAGAFSNSQFSAYFFSNQLNINLSQQTIILISFVSVFAQFIDSFLGACCQARYRCAKCGQVVEEKIHCATPAAKKDGFQWLTNDMVNFISILAGIFILWLCLRII
jgi:uncharacterized protein (TIGR00297 family)